MAVPSCKLYWSQTVRPHLREIVKFLRRSGAGCVVVDYRKNHPRVWYQWMGRQFYYVTAYSPSDRRATHNAIAELRRAEYEAVTREINRDIRSGQLMVTYKNRSYRVLYLGDTKHGRRAHLENFSSSYDFWIDAALIEEGIRQIRTRWLNERAEAERKRLTAER
jgi:hypothetical protein